MTVLQVGWEECNYDAHKRPAIGSEALHQVCALCALRTHPRHLVICTPKSFETMHGEAPLLPSLYLCPELHPSSLCHIVNLRALSLLDYGCIRGALVWLAVSLWNAMLSWFQVLDILWEL